jgi:hypothetical protein
LLGERVVSFIQHTGIPTLRATFAGLILVDEDQMPTPEQMEWGLGKGAGQLPEYPSIQDIWACLLTNERCEPNSWVTGTKLMVGAHTFLADSLFCEWAYLINLDDLVLEVYVGGNRSPLAPGRYAHLQEPGYNTEHHFYGVRHITSTPLAVIQEMSPEQTAHYLQVLENGGKPLEGQENLPENERLS